jgi:16S rRNA (adenine1518-N6/adenine1519-N6)-dimethyltransferase
MKDFTFKKSLGQNFLQDKNIIGKITNKENFEENSLIIEIGPGSGALTKELVKTGCEVMCFEIDKRLSEELSKIEGNISITYEDFLKVDLNNYLKGKKYNKLYVVSNLPYYITTPIISKIIDDKIEVYKMFLMMQKEVAERVLASPNSKKYGSLSVFLQYHFNIKKLILVSRNCFIPKPNVDSIVLRFEMKEKDNFVKDERIFFKLVRDSFKYKRKNLRNNLKEYDLVKITEVLNKHEKDLTFRAEQLSIREFEEISNLFSEK